MYHPLCRIHFSCALPARIFTKIMPALTNTKHAALSGILICSPSNSADKITPPTGLIKPNTAIFDTALYFSKMPHNVYATAETNAKYTSIATALPLACRKSPPKALPAATIISPPTKNCQPLSIAGLSCSLNFLINTELIA